MSTKIYEAYQFHDNLESLMVVLKKMRATIYEKALVKALHNVKPEDFVQYRYAEEFERIVKLGTWGETSKEFGYIENPVSSAVIYPHDGKLYVQFFGLPRDFRPPYYWFKDFHWQNQTDEPENVTKKAWAKRQRIWTEIMEPAGWQPSRAGLVFDFISEKDGIRLSLDMFRRIHGHSEYSETCSICQKRRAKIAQGAGA